jgi:hypothetical protein
MMMNDHEIIDKVPNGNFKSVLIQVNAITWGPTDYRSIADVKRIVELEDIMFDLLSLSSFAMSFPFEYDKLETLKEKT